MTANFLTIEDADADLPWLVLVHGMSQDHRVFSAQASAFRARYRLLLIDLPGHGLSNALPGPYGHLEFAAAVSGALDEAGIEACHYWATHTGVSLGLLLATREGGRFRSLILEGPVLPGHVLPSVEAEIDRARQTARSDGIEAALRQWFDHAGWFNVIRRNPEICRAADHWKMISEFSGAPWLDQETAQALSPTDDKIAALDLPVLIYNGEHDLDDFVAAADRLQALLPHARRAVIPGGGGFPAWEFPDQVNALAAEFLDGID